MVIITSICVCLIAQQKPTIDVESPDGLQPKKMRGHIEFRGVSFSYPSRPEIRALNDLSLTISSGQTVALVGSSGCGKSTCVQLLQRFYDPTQGALFIDGRDVRSLNVKWLRKNLGIVNQEPVLFNTSIIENIRYGRRHVSFNEVVRAAKDANAHDFIMKLPQVSFKL